MQKSEEIERFTLSVLAVALWVCAATYAWIVAAEAVPLPWGFAEVVVVGGASVVTVIRSNKPTEQMLARVYRAGVGAAANAQDNGKARSFSAGVEAGRYEREQDREEQERDRQERERKNGLEWTSEDGRRYDDAAAIPREEGDRE